MKITQLSSTCKVGRIIYNCHDLLYLAVSVTHPSNILSESSSNIGKIKTIYKHLDFVDIFYILYSQVEYDIISAKHFEILFEDSDHKTNCRKYWKTITKSNDMIKNKKRKTYFTKVNNDSANQIKSIKKEEKLFLI